MSNDQLNTTDGSKNEEIKSEKTTKKQEQSDPQLTELRGFVDPSEDLEPTLTDGTKSPEKAGDENAS